MNEAALELSEHETASCGLVICAQYFRCCKVLYENFALVINTRVSYSGDLSFEYRSRDQMSLFMSLHTPSLMMS